VVEYGGAVNNGPAGQVGAGTANPPHFGSGTDLFASVNHVINDGMAYVSSLPFEAQVAGIIVFFLALIVLKRAF
jgi:hypothetical protein